MKVIQVGKKKIEGDDLLKNKKFFIFFNIIFFLYIGVNYGILTLMYHQARNISDQLCWFGYEEDKGIFPYRSYNQRIIANIHIQHYGDILEYNAFKMLLKQYVVNHDYFMGKPAHLLLIDSKTSQAYYWSFKNLGFIKEDYIIHIRDYENCKK